MIQQILVLRVLGVTEVSAVVAAAGVLVGVAYYVLDMRNQSKVRQTDLITRLYSTFGSEELQKAGNRIGRIEYKDYDDFVKKYGAPMSEEEIPVAATKVFYFFEEVGLLLRKKLIEMETVDQLMGYNIMAVGTKLMPLIEEARKRYNEPKAYQNFEYLYNEMKKREHKL